MTVTSFLELQLRADRLEDAPAIVSETLAGTRAFDGCLGVDVVEDVTDASHLVVIERWQSLAHDDAYRAWRKTPDGASALGEIIAAPPVLTRYSTTDL